MVSIMMFVVMVINVEYTFSSYDPCQNVNCANGGTCTITSVKKCKSVKNVAVCACRGDWTGPTCNEHPCTKTPTMCNNGTCLISEDGTASCCCSPGCSGLRCDQNDDICSKLGGQCSGADACVDGISIDVPCCNGQRCCVNWSSTEIVEKLQNEVNNSVKEKGILMEERERLVQLEEECNCQKELDICQDDLTQIESDIENCQTVYSECRTDIEPIQQRLQLLDNTYSIANTCQSIKIGTECRKLPCRRYCVPVTIFDDLYNPSP